MPKAYAVVMGWDFPLQRLGPLFQRQHLTLDLIGDAGHDQPLRFFVLGHPVDLNGQHLRGDRALNS